MEGCLISTARRKSISLPLLVGLLTGTLVLLSAPTAAAFGFITKWGGHGIGHGQFNHPEAVATDADGNVYVTDHAGTGRRVVQEFTARGTFVAQWGSGGIAAPLRGDGIAIDRAGRVYVVVGDKVTRRYRALEFTSRGRLLRQWPLLRPRSGRVPEGIATDGSENVYVAVDTWIEKFAADGALLTRWQYTIPLVSHGDLFEAQVNGIATDAAGDVYVTGGHRITEFTGEGGFLGEWGSGPGEFGEPWGIATDRAGHVFVSDSRLNRVLEFTSEGGYLSQFGQTGSGNGQFRGPHFLTTDARGDLYVADTSNDRVQKFGEPSSAFGLTGVRLDRRRGSARLIANVAGVGRLDVGGTGIKAVRRVAKGAGEVALPIEPDGSTWVKFGHDGRAAVTARVTYTPTIPGTVVPASRSRRIILVRGR